MNKNLRKIFIALAAIIAGFLVFAFTWATVNSASNMGSKEIKKIEHSTVSAIELMDYMDKENHIEESSSAEIYYNQVEVEIVEVNLESMNGKVKITTPDIMRLLAGVIDNINIYEDVPYEELYEKVKKEFVNQLENDNYDKVTTEVEIRLVNTQDGAKIAVSDDINKAISNNVFDKLLSMYD